MEQSKDNSNVLTREDVLKLECLKQAGYIVRNNVGSSGNETLELAKKAYSWITEEQDTKKPEAATSGS